MTELIKRPETTFMDEVTRKGSGSVQWFLEGRHKQGTHPITHNNKLTFFICGEEAFGDIAAEIKKAERSIDLCCWGFDPGMELVRREGVANDSWPRGETFGDLLIAAGRRGVKVRLLVWYNRVASWRQHNMPGYSHDTDPWLKITDEESAKKISAGRSLSMALIFSHNPKTFRHQFRDVRYEIKTHHLPTDPRDLAIVARNEYCFNWYKAAFDDYLTNVEVLTRDGHAGAIAPALTKEKIAPDLAERGVMTIFGTHHQKPILIDYDYKDGSKAVGYVMGLNSLTDYWDTRDHLVDSCRRECGGEKEYEEQVQSETRKKKGPGQHTSLKPYHDYACRIDQGGALISIHRNFITAWKNALKSKFPTLTSEHPSSIPTHLLRKAEPGCSSVQVVRTQPEENDQTIQELYFLAAAQASAALRYLYIENQYFQYEEWSKRLIAARRTVVTRWQDAAKKSGRQLTDMPILHLIIVIPVPELEDMVPRTYDALATVGSHGSMSGQEKMIEEANKVLKAPGLAQAKARRPQPPEVVRYANTIDKPSIDELAKEFGMKVCVAMLNSWDSKNGRYRYREIYNHSKLMIVDDSFLTLGSANLNTRSMCADSEINIATDDRSLVGRLRKQVWATHGGKAEASGGSGSRQEITDAFDALVDQMCINRDHRNDSATEEKKKKLVGFLLPLEDDRSSTFRLA